MHWALGGPSEIRVISPMRQLEFAGRSRARMALLVARGDDGSTVVTAVYDTSGSTQVIPTPSRYNGSSRSEPTTSSASSRPMPTSTRAAAPSTRHRWRHRTRWLTICWQISAATFGASRWPPAAKELGSRRDQRAIEPLVGALTHPEEDVRRASAEALDSLGWRPATDEERATYLVAQQ